MLVSAQSASHAGSVGVTPGSPDLVYAFGELPANLVADVQPNDFVFYTVGDKKVGSASSANLSCTLGIVLCTADAASVHVAVVGRREHAHAL